MRIYKKWQIISVQSISQTVNRLEKGLILRNTGFIITGTITCLCVECRQVIEDFINRLMVFRGEICVGRVSGRRRYPKTEVFQYLPYYLLVSDKADDLHPVR